MNSKNEKDKVKQLQDKCQNVLNNLLRDEDNKYCVDCDSKGPRWASWNIGVFLCIRCAGIHRNLGVHISRVKSVNLDTWTPEQVVSLQQMGNSRARAVYEANLPDNFRRPQNDLNLESFIRAKYEHKKYIAREWVPAPLPKVNWEKEIEEEMEKSKRKTKNVVEKKTLPTAATVEVPQLPKPKNSSPKPNRIVNKDNDDLLISQNGDDSFSNFLSSMSTSLISSTTTTTTTTKEETEKTDIISEEESFFNQTLPTEKEKIQISKDSIMKLYATIPVNNFNQFHNPLGQPSYQANMPMYQNFGLNSSTSSTISSNPLNYQMPQYLGGQQFPNQCVGQQFPLPNQIQLPNLQMSMTNQLNQFGQQQQPQPQQQQQQQPFMNLQQQFGMMNMNGQQQQQPQFQSSNTNTTTNNLWQ